MGLTKLCGYDVNGFRDQAARNWEITADGEERHKQQITRGDLLSSVVLAGTNAEKRWIGGAQADLAPHGRGGGWGDVGSTDRRIVTRDLLAGDSEIPEALGAAYTGLVSGARYNVFAVDDVGGDLEKQQERVLQAAQKAHLSNPLLVWRSVLAVLFNASQGVLSEGQLVGVISHCDQGLAIQKMRILSHSGVLAPERKQPAQLIRSVAGLDEMVMTARRLMLKGEDYSSRNSHRPKAKMVASLALGEPVAAELLRDNRGRWDLLEPQQMILPKCDITQEDFAELKPCDVIIFESVAAGSIADLVSRWCEDVIDEALIRLPHNAVALGALEAAHRVQKRSPVYFDFLPQISTIVQTGNKAESYDLIREGDTVEAGRLYRSPEPAQLAIPARQKTISVYLRKESIEWPRRAIVDIGQPLKEAAPVDLLVEQKPASGRARILMESRDIGRQYTVDWDEAEIIDMDWEPLVASLEAHHPSIPDRLVLPTKIDAWQTGLPELLKENVDREIVDWEALAQKMRSRVNQGYCVSSDGDLPPELSHRDVERLDRLTERAMEETEERVAGQRNSDNEALAFLTWQFRRCPSELVPMMMDCLAEKGRHPFVWTPSNWVLIYQGLARILSDPTDEAFLLQHVMQKPIGPSEWRTKTACLAMILSRSETAPSHLTSEDIELLARRVLFELNEVVGESYNRFLYARFLLGGLLRWRSIEPYALVPGYDPLGQLLIEAIEAILADFDLRAQQSSSIKQAEQRFRPTFEGLLSELKGDGHSPDLLLNIYQTS